MSKPVKMVCRTCGSEDITAEVTAVRWSVEHQEWFVSGDVCDKGHYCNNCDGECRLDAIELTGTNTSIEDATAVSFVKFLDHLRHTGTQLNGTNAQVASLIQAGLQIIDPDSLQAQVDARLLEIDFHVISEALLLDDQARDPEASAEYPDKDDA